MTPTYLSELSSRRYQIVFDEAWYHERPEIRAPDRRWYEQIPVRNGGHIYIYSEDPPALGLYSTQIKSARSITMKVPGLRAEWMVVVAVIYSL